MPPSQSTSRIPPLLAPYIRLPTHDSILLTTSTLGASANWLLIRFLYEVLGRNRSIDTNQGAGQDDEKEVTKVVLVSWMRDWEFWKSEGRKGAGLDLERLRREGRMAWVDGLSGLFGEMGQEEEKKEQNTMAPTRSMYAASSPSGRGPAPVRSPAPARGGPPSPSPVAQRSPASPLSPSTREEREQAKEVQKGLYTLTSPSPSHLVTTLKTALASLHPSSTTTTTNVSSPPPRTLLLLDTPSLLLAAHPSITPSTLCSTLLTLHTLFPHLLVHMPADSALLTLSSPPQPLEIDARNFLVKAAHLSHRVLACRVLDTGVARDVSGVVGITGGGKGRGGAGGDVDADGKGREFLYRVGGDGGVRVWERGAGG